MLKIGPPKGDLRPVVAFQTTPHVGCPNPSSAREAGSVVYGAAVGSARPASLSRSVVSEVRDGQQRAMQLGHAEVVASIDQLRAAGREFGWEEVPLRRGDPAHSRLLPIGAADARRNSMSQQYGLCQQPLHTDGAHLRMPPDLVVMGVRRPSSTATLLWSGLQEMLADAELRDALEHGVFVVDRIAESFLTTAVANGRIRFDPVCMRPQDQRARRSTRAIAASRSHAHRWTDPRRLLIIDNRRTLHARAAFTPSDGTRVLDRLTFRLGCT